MSHISIINFLQLFYITILVIGVVLISLLYLKVFKDNRTSFKDYKNILKENIVRTKNSDRNSFNQ